MKRCVQSLKSSCYACVMPTYETLKSELAGERMYTWLQLLGCLVGCLLCSGLAPGAILWIQILGENAKFNKLCDVDTGCERKYCKFVGVFIVGGAVSYLILLPMMVLVDYMGTRLISFIGGVLVVAGNLLYFFVLIPDVAGSSEILFWTLLSLAVLFADTGAHMVMTVMQGFAWHIDEARHIAYVFFTIVVNLSGLLPLLIRLFNGLLAKHFPDLQFFEVVGLSYLGYLCLPALGFLLIFLCAIPQDEYIQAAETVLDIHIPPHKVSLATFRHIGRALKNTQQVLHYDKSFHMSHIVFIIVMSFTTTWATMYVYFSSNYGADLFETADDKEADYQMSVGVTIIVCSVGMVMSIGGTWLVGQFGEDDGDDDDGITGMEAIVILVIGAEVIAIFTIMGRHWFEQVITAIAAGVVLALSQVMVHRHMFHYAPPKMLGPTHILFNSYRIVVSALVSIISLYLVTRLGKRTTFIFMLAMSMGSMVFYLIYIKVKGFPSSVPLIKHEVDDLCCSYCCKNLSDVLYIIGLENTAAGVKMLTSAGPELHSELVMSVHPERIEEIMSKSTIEEIAQTMERGPAWSSQKDEIHIDGLISSFALTPWLWAQFMQEQIEISDLSSEAGDLISGKATEEKKDRKSITGTAAQSELARNIMRAMDARVHTKEFLRILRQQDSHLLDFCLMNKDVSLMCETLWDMIDWDTGIANAYPEEGKEGASNFDKFKVLMPFKSLAQFMIRRPDLKRFVIDVLKVDLVQAIRQEKGRRWQRRGAHSH